MPEEIQSTPPSISPTVEKPKRNWRKILLILLVVLLLVSLVGVGLWLIPKLTKEPTSPTQKQATPSAKVQPKTKKLVWIVGREIWMKELNKKAQKVLTEDEKILDWDLLGNDKVVYITAEASNDIYYGTKILRFNLKTKKKDTLLEIPLNTILSEVKKPNLCQVDDPDISAISASPDGKSLVFARLGVWKLDLATNKAEQIVETSQLQTKGKPQDSLELCTAYAGLDWVEGQNLELDIGRYEVVETALLNVKDKNIIYRYLNGGYVPRIMQISYSNSNPIFIKSIDPAFNVANKRSIIGEGVGLLKEESFKTEGAYYSSDSYINDRVIANNKVYFVETTIPNDSSQPYGYIFKSFSLDTKKTLELFDFGTIDSNSAYDVKCLAPEGSNLYFEAFEKPFEVNVYKLDVNAKKKSLVEKISFNEKDNDLVGCFQTTIF
jgi:hypothetical protein